MSGADVDGRVFWKTVVGRVVDAEGVDADDVVAAGSVVAVCRSAVVALRLSNIIKKTAICTAQAARSLILDKEKSTHRRPYRDASRTRGVPCESRQSEGDIRASAHFSYSRCRKINV